MAAISWELGWRLLGQGEGQQLMEEDCADPLFHFRFTSYAAQVSIVAAAAAIGTGCAGA